MSDWSSVILCEECGKGNPCDTPCCINCGHKFGMFHRFFKIAASKLFERGAKLEKGGSTPAVDPIASTVLRLVEISRHSPSYLVDSMSASSAVARFGTSAIPVILAAADKHPDGRDRLAGTLGAICKMHREAITEIKTMLGQGCSPSAREVIEHALREAGQ
jgi:hypothetical protein